MISFVSSVIIWGLIAMLVFRTLHFSGLTAGKIPSSSAYNYLSADLRLQNGGEEKYKALYIFVGAFAFRIAMYLLEVVILMTYNNGDFTISTLLRRMEIWDSTNYYRIAEVGYSGYQENGTYTTLAFFPLYPYVARILSIVIRNLRVSLLLTTGLSFAGGSVYLYKLCCMDYGSSTAKRAVILTAVAPFGCFFGTMMSESMLFFTSIAALYYIRKHSWSMAGIFGALAALSRLVGILVALSAVVEWLEYYRIIEKLKNKQFGEVWKLFYTKGLWIFLMFAGVLGYLLCNYIIAGNPFAFLELQRTTWGHGSAYFGRGISNVFSGLVGSDQQALMRRHLPSVISIICVIVALIYGARRNRTMYSVYLLAYLVVNMSVDYIISTPRYMSCAIPVYIFLADFTARHKKSEEIITVMSAICFGVFFVAYLHDIFV